MLMTKDIHIKVRGLILKGVLENSEARKLMILVHGFTGDMHGPDNIFEKLSTKLQEHNFAVLRFSFVGTPPSEGDFRDMTVELETEDLREIIIYAQSMGYSQIGLLGESMGGTVVTKAYEETIKTVVFWYSTFNFSKDAFMNYYREGEQNELKAKGYVLTDGYKVGKKFIDQIPTIDVEKETPKIVCPVLFLHGDSDTDVPYRQSVEAFARAHEPKELHLIKGANHCFINEQKEAIGLTVDFLDRYFK